MLTVNNTFINVSAGTNPVQDGDVIRWQFSLCGFGRDLGQNIFETAPAYIQTANKDALTAAVAKASAVQKNTSAYDDAIAVLKNLETTQEQVDNASQALQ